MGKRLTQHLQARSEATQGGKAMSKEWTNKMIQRDPEGYLVWQREQKGKDERERKEAEEERDFQRFRRLFIERGGADADARSSYKRFRNDQALQEAMKLDQEASNQMRSDRSRMV
jgi:hypothetical protein